MCADRPSGLCSSFTGGAVAPVAVCLAPTNIPGGVYEHFKLCLRVSCMPSLLQAVNGEKTYSQEPAAEAAPPAESPAVPDEAAAAPEVLPPPPPGAAIPKPPPGALPPPPSVWAPPGVAVLATALQVDARSTSCLGVPLHAAPASWPTLLSLIVSPHLPLVLCRPAAAEATAPAWGGRLPDQGCLCRATCNRSSPGQQQAAPAAGSDPGACGWPA